MKPTIYPLAIFIFICHTIHSQTQGKNNQPQLGQTVIRLNLHPNETNIIKDQKNDFLKANNRYPLSFRIENINPLKYRYVLNHTFIGLFGEGESNVDNPISDLLNGKLKQRDISTPTDLLELYNKEKGDSSVISEKQNTLQENLKTKSKSTGVDIEFQQLNQMTTFEDLLENEEILRKSLNSMITLEYGEIEQVIKTIKNYELELKEKNELDFNQIGIKIDQLENALMKHTGLVSDFVKTFKNQLDNETLELVRALSSKVQDGYSVINKIRAIPQSHQTLPLDVFGGNYDKIEITLERYPTDPAENQIIDTHKYDVWIFGGWKFDFSAGIFRSNLKDNTYSTIAVESGEGEAKTTRHQIVQEDTGNFEWGLGTTLNINYRSARYLSFGFAFGGYVTSLQKFRAVIGPTVILGKEQRAIFGGGLALGQVTRLSERFNLTDTFDLGSEGDVSTIEKFDSGFYLSFTYNLSKTKVKN